MTTATSGQPKSVRASLRSELEHGGPDLNELRALGLEAAGLVDFSVCTNPFGTSPRVAEALSEVALDRYPDRDALLLRAALAKHHGIAEDEILAGNGASELIWLTALAFIRRGDHVLVLGPTYGEYARAAALQGGAVTTYSAQAPDGFAVSVPRVEALLGRLLPRLVFLCNPNNPTGAVLEPEVIRAWAKLYPHTLFVVDEAYQAFGAGLESLVTTRPGNLLVLRSMTKDYALAGLRVGYAVGSTKLLAELARVRPPWSVNAVAQLAAQIALADQHHLDQSLAKLRTAKLALVQSLANLGLSVCASTTHYFLVYVGDASALRLRLLRKGILVRDAASFGLPGYVRLATRRPEDNALLVAALQEEAW